MPINAYFLTCEPLFEGRTGTPFDANGQRDYLRKFRVVVTELGRKLGPIAVCTCPGIPFAYSPYQTSDGREYDLLALLTRMDATQEHKDDWQNWIVDCRYSTRLPPGGTPPVAAGGRPSERATQGNSAMNNPELEPPEIDWDFEIIQKAIPKDLDGKPFLNSAKQPFSPPPTFERAYPVLNFSRNELTYDFRTATRYAYAVNKDEFLGEKPGTVQCMPSRAKQTYRGSLAYWRVSYKFRFANVKGSLPNNKVVNVGEGGFFGRIANELIAKNLELETWQPEFLDAGTMQLAKGTGDPKLEHQPIPIIVFSIPITSPVLLDGAGRRALPDANGVIQPVFLPFRVRAALSFSKLLSNGFAPS